LTNSEKRFKEAVKFVDAIIRTIQGRRWGDHGSDQMRWLRVDLRIQAHGLPRLRSLPELRNQESAAHQQGRRLSEVPGALLFRLRTLPRVRFNAADRFTAMQLRSPRRLGKTGSNRKGLGAHQARARWVCAGPRTLDGTELASCLAWPFVLELIRSGRVCRARATAAARPPAARTIALPGSLGPVAQSRNALAQLAQRRIGQTLEKCELLCGVDLGHFG
jgi:hypothetical protein